MRKSIFIFLLLLLVISCKKTPSYQKQVNKELKEIHSIEGQKQFLQKIYDDSEALILKKEDLEKDYFKNRDSLRMVESEILLKKEINFYRAKKYLENYQYPDSINYSKEERLSIYYTLLNHTKISEQLEYCSIFKEAYKNGSLNKYDYLSYLFRIYYLYNDSFYKFDKKQSIEEIIAELEPIVFKYKKKV